jgi:16S rRNA processing protein RimM
MEKYYVVGKIVNTHGVRGEVRVISKTDFPEERYKKGNKLYFQPEHSQEMLELIVSSHRQHKQFDLLTFKGYESLNEVEFLKGGILKVSEDQLQELDDDEFYYHEIIGCEVISEEGEIIGKVEEILSPGANDVWVIQRPKGKDVLIPYIEDVVKEVNVSKKQVTIHVMKGLIDDED